MAHSCNTASLPGQGDEVGFLVTRINDEREVAEGLSQELLKENRNFVPETVPDAVFLFAQI